MSELEDLIPPEEDIDDQAHQVARTVLGSIWGLGKLFEELFITRVPRPIEKRLHIWRQMLIEVINKIQLHSQINMERLENDEEFASVLFHATWIAMKSHQKEKLTALRNAVINAACQIDIQEDEQLLFIRYLDELTPTHLCILKFFVQKYDSLVDLRSYEEIYKAFVSFLPSEQPSEISHEMFKLVCEDLKARVLMRVSSKVEDFSGLAGHGYLLLEADEIGPNIIVTQMGRNFLRYIEE